MQDDRKSGAFEIEEARRVLGEVFAPWVHDLGLSVDRIDCAPPPGSPADWQPGAVLRMAFSERLCRHGGIVCGQALMALADTSMVFAILAANRGYRPMTTVDQTTHFMRAVVNADVLAYARVVAAGAHHKLRSRHTVECGRQQAGGDGIERLCDAVKLPRLWRLP